MGIKLWVLPGYINRFQNLRAKRSKQPRVVPTVYGYVFNSFKKYK